MSNPELAKRTTDLLGTIDGWSVGKRAAVIWPLILVAHILYLLVWEAFAGNEPQIATSAIRALLVAWLAYVVMAWLMAIAQVRFNSHSELPVQISIVGYGVFGQLLAFGSGIVDSVYTAFPLIIIVVSLLIFGLRLAVIFTVCSVGLTLALVGAQASGLFGFAPLFPMTQEFRNSAAWIGPSIFWLLQCFALVAICVWLVDNSRRHAIGQLERSREGIRRYVPPAVADEIIQGRSENLIQPIRRRVTILFADVAGFTEIADQVEPEVMTQVLGEYLAAMSRIIEDHGGTLNEFAGDGFMALFGAPVEMTPERQALAAVAAAQSMQAELPGLNIVWRKLGIPRELRIRVGINTGVASVGSFGSHGRMTYTAIGIQTNLASRIEGQAEPGSILISDATRQLVGNSFEVESLGSIECKGLHYPVEVHRILGG